MSHVPEIIVTRNMADSISFNTVITVTARLIALSAASHLNKMDNSSSLTNYGIITQIKLTDDGYGACIVVEF